MTWQSQQTELLTGEIAAVLVAVSTETEGLGSLARIPLGVVRRGLSDRSGSDVPWPLLPMMVCEAVSGQYKQAVPIATAMQFLFASGDVFDDVEDTGTSKALFPKCSLGVATNVATLLLVLAESSIVRLKNFGVEDKIIPGVMESLNAYYITACIGQHLDLSSEQENELSESEYLRIIGMKSASQIECACHTGALVASASEELLSDFNEFGHNLGMASQIINDIEGINNGDDIEQRKITLPVIYAVTQTYGEIQQQLKLAFDKNSQMPPDIVKVKELIRDSGAIYYSILQSELYKQKALKALSQAAAIGAKVKKLEVFLA